MKLAYDSSDHLIILRKLGRTLAILRSLFDETPVKPFWSVSTPPCETCIRFLWLSDHFTRIGSNYDDPPAVASYDHPIILCDFGRTLTILLSLKFLWSSDHFGILVRLWRSSGHCNSYDHMIILEFWGTTTGTTRSTKITSITIT